MKLIFAHDHIFKKFDNQYYSNGSFSKDVLDRYTNVFDEVVIISRQKKINEYNSNLTLASTEKVRFVEVPNFKSFSKILKIFKAKKIIAFEIENCDALIARLPSSIGALAVSTAKRKKIPYLIEVVACPWDTLWNHSLKGKFIAPIEYWSLKKNAKDAKYALYVSSEFLQRRYKCYGKTIDCSDVFIKPSAKDTLDNRLKKINEMTIDAPIVLGTVAAVNVRHKGQKYVIKAISKLNKQGYNFEYHLVGSGNQKYLRELAKKLNVSENVKFLGPLPHDQVFDFLENIDIYVQPSNAEGLARAIVEAISLGCPVIGSSSGGTPELVSAKFVFKRKNTKDLERKLKMMTIETMRDDAKRSFEKSKEFQIELLDLKRNTFFNTFIQDNNLKFKRIFKQNDKS